MFQIIKIYLKDLYIINIIKNILNQEWDNCYKKKENYCFYPNEELIKFLNRFISKKNDVDNFISHIGSNIRALDFGCGIGTSTNIINEFKIDCTGVDISKDAIDYAKKIYPKSNFELIDSTNLTYDDLYFDFTISIHCLDCMSHEITKLIFKELMRVSKKYIFITLVSPDELDNKSYDGEVVVKSGVGKDTIRNYFTLDKINKLIDGTNFKIKFIEKVSHFNILNDKTIGRFYILFERKNV